MTVLGVTFSKQFRAPSTIPHKSSRSPPSPRLVQEARYVRKAIHVLPLLFSQVLLSHSLANGLLAKAQVAGRRCECSNVVVDIGVSVTDSSVPCFQGELKHRLTSV